MTRCARRLLFCSIAGLLLCAGSVGCGSDDERGEYAARVGDEYLTKADLQHRLSQYSGLTDTASARQHIIDSWITEQLLYREALRQDLADQPDVQEQLRAKRRSVLVNALVERLKENAPSPSETSIQTYYQQHQAQLRLREPFLRLRYAALDSRGAARELRTALVNAADSAAADSIWHEIVDRFAADPTRARRLSRSYHPASQLQRELPAEQLDLAQLSPGTIPPVIENNGTYHLIQVTDRLDEGTLPPLEQVRDQILQQLIIQEKKLMYTREVQRLRTRARANNAIEIRN